LRLPKSGGFQAANFGGLIPAESWSFSSEKSYSPSRLICCPDTTEPLVMAWIRISFLQDIFHNVSPKLGRTLTRQMLAKQLKQTTKTQGGVSSASLIWHQNIQLASPGVNPIFHDVIYVTSLENANENK